MSAVTVFVSSKMRELHAEREFLHQLIPKLDLGAYQQRPWMFEAPQGAPASASSIREVYLDALQRSALYIGIIGVEYGEWTIDEFNHATRWGIDRHLYVKGAPEQERAPQLKVFLDRWNDVETGITVKFFTTLDDLAQAVTRALEVWTTEQVQARPPSFSAQVLTAPDQVPERTSRLFGRSEIFESILSDLKSGNPTLVCGFAGTGETAIAASICEAWLTQESPWALWLRCGFARVEELVAAIARSIHREIAPHTLSHEEHLQTELELVIKGDADIASTALQSFDVTMTMAKPTRFISEAGVIIGVAAGLVKLVNALIDLAERLRKEPQAPKVTARNVASEQLLLNSADNEAIKSFVHASAD